MGLSDENRITAEKEVYGLHFFFLCMKIIRITAVHIDIKRNCKSSGMEE